MNNFLAKYLLRNLLMEEARPHDHSGALPSLTLKSNKIQHHCYIMCMGPGGFRKMAYI